MTAHEAAPIDVHDERLTAVRAARRLDEFARALNYATLPHAVRLDYASDVYTVLGSLREALAKLPQACGQLAAFLESQQRSGVLRAERGYPHADRPNAAVAEAVFKLNQASIGADVTAAALARAQVAISGLSHDEPTVPAAQPPSARKRPAAPVAPPARGTAIEP